MAFTLSFGKADKAKNSTKVPSVSGSVNCLLKENTSVIAPTFIIRLGYGGAPSSLTVLSEMNYCYCSEFKRYYFISNIISETATVVNIACEVDVLATFVEDIKATSAFVLHSESRFNALCPDHRLPILASSTQTTNKVSVGMFDSEGSFALTGVTPTNTGSLGAAATIYMGASNLQQLAAKLYADDFWEGIKNDFYHPEEALLACMWTPIQAGQVTGGGASTLKIGKYDIYTGLNIKATVTGTQALTFPVPYPGKIADDVFGYGDYRNFDPYCRYYAMLPGVGLVEICMRDFYGHSTGLSSFVLNLNIAASPVTGDVTYTITRMDAPGGIAGNGVGMVVKGNFGVEVPISRTVGRYGSVLQAVGGGVTSIAAGGMMGPIGLGIGAANAVGGLASSAINALNVNTVTVGSLGGWSVQPVFNYNIETTVVAFDITDNPSNIRKTIGRPLFANVSSLGSLRGFVQCCGAHVKTWATAQELEIINQFVNSEKGFGGIIIE